MSDELKSSPFGSIGKIEIEGKGQTWRGVKGYSEPQYFFLRHHGDLREDDTFQTVYIEIRARTEAQAISLWNTRADLTPTPAQIMAHPKVQALVEALKCADAALSGANMDMKAVDRKIRAALAALEDKP